VLVGRSRVAALALVGALLVLAGSWSAPAAATPRGHTVSVTSPTPAPPAPRRIVTGWLPYWTTAASLSTLTANAKLFGEVSPFWYGAFWDSAKASTKIVNQTYDVSIPTVVAQVHALGVKIVPTVVDDTRAGQLSTLLSTAAGRTHHVAQLLALVMANGFDGVDLDYENFAFADGEASWNATRPRWDAFIQALATALHAQGKMLTVDIPPMYSDTSGYWVYDYRGIAPWVDRVRIMAYDYSFSSPGPIAPFAWVAQVVAFAVTRIPAGKVQIGVPSYGYDWRTTTTGTCPTLTESGTALPATTSGNLAWARGSKHEFDARWSSWYLTSMLPGMGVHPPDPVWDPVTREKHFTYQITFRGGVRASTGNVVSASCSIARTVWYDDAAAAQARATLVNTYHVSGIAEWTLGGEDLGQWAGLTSYATSIAAVPSVVTATAPALVMAGQSATVTGSVVLHGVPVTGTRVAVRYTETYLHIHRMVPSSRSAIAADRGVEE